MMYAQFAEFLIDRLEEFGNFHDATHLYWEGDQNFSPGINIYQFHEIFDDAQIITIVKIKFVGTEQQHLLLKKVTAICFWCKYFC